MLEFHLASSATILANAALEGKKHHLNFQLSSITISLNLSKVVNQLGVLRKR